MSFIPILKAHEIVKILLKVGFKIVRQKGSHVRLNHIFDFSRKVSVPIHNKDVSPRILKSILKQAKISLEEFLKILKK